MTDQQDPVTAVFRQVRWPGVIWSVPIIAFIIVGWLGLSAYLHRGPMVTVTFPISGGLDEGSTVEYRGLVVGHVADVRVGKSLSQMQVDIRFESTMNGHLGAGTLFWIAGRQVSITDLSSLKSVIAGPYIDILPHDGPTDGEVVGLGSSPVVNPELAGINVVISAAHKGNLSPGAGIFYGGFRIGTVENVAMIPDGSSFIVNAFIEAPYTHLLSSNSRFWNADGVAFQTSGGEPRISFLSLGALVSGALGVSTPKGGKTLAAADEFVLYANETLAVNAPGPYAVLYRTVIPGGPDGLAVGAPVTLEGEQIGDVQHVAMAFNQATGSLETAVDLQLDPERIPLAGGAAWDMADPRPQMDHMLAHLIAHGLRARLAQTVPMIGQEELALVIMPDATSATLMPGAIPMIPAIAGDSTANLLAQVSDVMANLKIASAQLAALSQSPQTRHTLEHLSQTAGNVAAITLTTRQQVPALLADMRKATSQADQALQSAHELLAVNGGDAASPEAQTLPRALYELTRAAMALRELTNELQAHPNALIFGR